MVPVWITKVVNARALTLFIATLAVGSVIVPVGFIVRFDDLNASGQENTTSAGIVKIFSSELEFADIRIYAYMENRTIDLHLGEPALSTVTDGTQVVFHGIASNHDYTGEHFDYITEVFDGAGMVVSLDVRYGIAVPLGGSAGVDTSSPYIFEEPGTYIVKLLAVSNLKEGPTNLLAAISMPVVVVDPSTVDAEPELPNIVVVMADDLDQRSMDILLEKGRMPNLQRYIIDEGVTFSSSFASYPLCCPSRATFLTGQYPHNHNVWNNEPPLGGVSKLDDSSTLATWLNYAGYHTTLVGKYLNRYGQDTTETYIAPGWDNWQATVGGSAYRMYQYTVNDNGVLVKYRSQESDYQTDVLTQRAVQEINQVSASIDSTPFFMWINPLAPHNDGQLPDCSLNYGSMGITRPPQRYLGASDDIEFPRVPSLNEADVSDKPRALQETLLTDEHISCFEDMFHARLESMLAVDDMIGSIVTALDQNNEDNTILIFTSDNGYLLGEHRLHGKQYVYEESIRLPLYMRIPGVSQNTIDKLVINNDLAPTLLEYAKAKPSAGFKIDGRSLVPLIQDPTIQWRNGFLIEDNLYNAIRTEDYVYAVRHTGDKEVYDLISDPYQLENLAGRSSWESKIDALDEWRIALAECSGEDCKILEDRSAP